MVKFSVNLNGRVFVMNMAPGQKVNGINFFDLLLNNRMLSVLIRIASVP